MKTAQAKMTRHQLCLMALLLRSAGFVFPAVLFYHLIHFVAEDPH